MPRSIWSGSISFGLVNVPVKVYSAVHQHDLRFHQFDEETDSRIRYRKGERKGSSSGRERTGRSRKSSGDGRRRKSA